MILNNMPSRTEVLKLYKKLILYSKTLSLTDPVYFRRKITAEFQKNKCLTNTEDIQFAYQVKHYLNEGQLSNMFFNAIRLRATVLPQMSVAFKHTIDYSRVPKIYEHELSEQFVRGGGPGGSAVNKNANCVVLTHEPTGTVIKCHISRCQDENRKLAREMLVEKLDEIINGDLSVVAQRKRLQEKKLKRNEYKKKKIAQLKSEWKKREGLT